MPKIPFWVFILLAFLHLSAIRIDTMDVDASQYAEMSREMALSGDYLHLYDRGAEYLDKPPFLFWVSSASIKVFGVNNLGYKLPSILFAFLAMYATYRLAKLLYNEATGRMAALILGTSQGMFLMTNDIRCDTILMAWVITAIWAIKECEIKRRWQFVVLGVVSIACGMMTKGPIALMVPGFCFGSDWVLKRKWKNIFNPWHLLDLTLIAVLLIPMSIGLYQQFDMHPEKTVNGLQHVSGLRFFYWSQSFGRITGESPWQNGADMSFLLVNMLWSFLPWIFLLLIALAINIGSLIKQKFRLQEGQEWITTGGFLLAYLSLGSSHYQLPHYIFVAFPLAAIIVAKLLKDFFEGEKYKCLYAIMKPAMTTVLFLLFMAILALITYIFPSGALAIVLWGVCFAGWLYIVFKKNKLGKLLWVSAGGMMLLNIFVTHFFYYPLLKYQLGSQLGRYIKNENIPSNKIVAYRVGDPLNCLPFYAERLIKSSDSLPNISDSYIITMDEGIADLQQKGYAFDIVKKGERFKVSELTPGFINPKTRAQAINNYYLVKLK
jgi:hypothetical protein